MLISFGVVIMGLFPVSVLAGEAALKDQALNAMRRAAEFFRTKVSTEGGYLWRYSEDLSLREGEGKATDTMVWVQPPGTPSVGMVYLTAYEATGDFLSQEPLIPYQFVLLTHQSLRKRCHLF